MKKAFGYIRVSGQGQVEKDGPVRQEKAIRDYAKANGFEVVKIYHENGVSGTTDLENRPALAEMMVSLEQNGHGVKTVIIERIDRLARDLMVQETILADFQKNGVSVVLSNGDVLDDDPHRKLVRQLLGAIAEYDKTMTVLKLRAARDRKRARDGKCEGRKGYSDVHADVVAEVKRLHRKPRGGKRLTSVKIADRLNDSGITTATGKPFTSQIVRNILHKA